jgi:hypothetical protein
VLCLRAGVGDFKCFPAAGKKQSEHGIKTWAG